MSITAAITTGLGQLLHEHGIGTWQADGMYAKSVRVPITVGLLPQQYDRAIALTVYGSDDDPLLADTTVMLQARFRGGTHPDDANALADDLFDLLQGREDFTLAGVHVIRAHRQSWAPLGLDDNRRWERSDNYRLHTHNPTTHRTF